MSNPVSNADAAFLKNFALLIGFLVLVALALIGLASYIYGQNPPPQSPAKHAAVEQRITPAGAVYAGETGAAEAQKAKDDAAKAAASQVAYGGTTDGKTIFGNLCHTCHEAGLAGAPKVGDKAAWGPRITQGIDTLVAHATNGYTGESGVMPPKGGNPALNDAQIKATVEWMVAQAK